MARIQKFIADFERDELKKYISNKYGKPVTYSLECESLSNDIKNLCGVNIGSNTIRRFYGFLPNNSFSASLKTLNILAEYAGFTDWYSFTQICSPTYKALTLAEESAIYLDFYKIKIRPEGDMNYHNACRNIAFRILFNDPLLSNLAPALSKIATAQVYFYERFPYIDGLCNSYKLSIQLYLRKKTEEAQIFGNSLLFLSAFLSNNISELKKYYTRINKIGIHEKMHPFVIARYIGSNILFNYNEEERSFCIKEVYRWNRFFLLKKNEVFWNYPYYQHMICDYLNLAGLFSESSEVFRTIRQDNGEYQIEEGYAGVLDIIKHINLYQVNPEKFTNWVSSFNFYKISPLFRKYGSVI